MSKNSRTPKRFSNVYKTQKKHAIKYPFLWQPIPYKHGFNPKEKFWHLNLKYRLKKLNNISELELNKIPICPFSKQEITRALIEEHPPHIAQCGYCIYCGRLKESDEQ
jgi:hypothetical protein